MLSENQKNILSIIKNSLKAIAQEDTKTLKDLSNHTIHTATVVQDIDSISIAIVIYSLSKIFERSKYETYKDWPIFKKTCIQNLQEAHQNLAKNNIPEYRKNIKTILDISKKLETHLKRYIKEVIEKARVAKASRLYEHGISAAQTAELLGISEWELQEYAGKTGISDVTLALTKSVKERLRFTRSLFK